MVFFLARDLETIVRRLLTKLVKCSVVSLSTGIARLLRMNIGDLKKHIPFEKVDIGHTAEQVLKTSKLCARDVFTYKMECWVSVTKKILDNSHLRYPVGGGFSLLNPRQMYSKPDGCLSGLEKVLDTFIMVKKLSDQQ